MLLSPALRRMVADATAKYQANEEQAREYVLSLIGGTLERIHATPSGELVDYPQEAMDLLEALEVWCVGHHDDGYLIFHNPKTTV